MRRVNASSRFFLVLVGLLVAIGPALAQPPDILQSYQFIERLSTLRETGGIAGIVREYPVFGTYDFITGFRFEPSIETDAMFIRPYAQFTNVEAYGAHPLMDPGLHLDVVLNLSELDGRPIFHGPFGLDLFRFEGTAGPSTSPSRVELLAARLGQWMYLRANTEAPCCDRFEYQLRGLARELPWSDWDDDGTVGAADLDHWRSAYGSGMTGRDFLEWQRQYGEEAPSLAVLDALVNDALAAVSAAALAVVPEPCSACLLAVCVLCYCVRGRYPL